MWIVAIIGNLVPDDVARESQNLCLLLTAIENMEKKFPSWDSFKAKYPSEQLQRDRFEDLARALFCDRYGIKYGIFQCYNHAGNETNTVNDGEDVIGFNAKFFNNGIDVSQITHSIEIAHNRHPDQTKMLIYTNAVFGNPPFGKEKTKLQEDVEDFATTKGITIEWVNDKMILDHVVKIDWVYEFFFELDSPIECLIKAEESIINTILVPIHTSIIANETEIKIDYSSEREQIIAAVQQGKHVVIYGEGGCGKTALLKSIWESAGQSMPICIRKAQDVKATRIDNLFDGGIDTFVNAYKDEGVKVMVIDSAERIQNIDDTSTLESFITLLKDNGWSIVFTVRNGFLESLLDDLNFKYDINPTLVRIEPLSTSALKDIANGNNFELPSSDSFSDRLRTLFYLNLYLKFYEEIDRNGGYSKFSGIIWREKIAGRVASNGRQIKRSQLFEKFIEQRIISDSFYLNEDLFDSEIAQLLVDDEVLARNEKGLFITHDIYEEWGLNRAINKKWHNRNSIVGFVASLDDSFLVRKAFRQWLKEQIDSQVEDIKELLNKSFDLDIEPLWRDEILIGIMESSYACTFFANEKDVLLTDNAKLLNRIVFLLQLACKRLDRVITYKGHEYPIYVPFGSGWEAVIHILFELRGVEVSIPYKNKVLKEWVANNQQGAATREAGLMALDIWALTEEDDTYFYDKELIKDLCSIVINSASEIKTELCELFKKVVVNRWNSHRDPYYELCHYILSKPTEAYHLIATISDGVFPLMDLFWKGINESTDNDYPFGWSRKPSSMNRNFGLNGEELEGYSYSSPCAYQTPLFILLATDYIKAVKYIVGFTNDIIDSMIESEERGDDLEEVKISLMDGSEVTQYGSYSLWGLYRGAIHITYPDIMQSMHMALEKVLLEFAENDKYDSLIKNTFDYLLSKSKSVSLTAVVASVVMAHPTKYSEYAVNLFKTIELFHWDSIRLMDESQLSTFYGLWNMHDRLVAKERFDTLQQSFRKRNLESLCVEYQYTRCADMDTEKHESLVKDIYVVLDKHYTEAKAINDETRLILLYRMDRRTHNPKISTITDGRVQIEMNPQLPDELKEISDDSQASFMEQMRFTNLLIWCEKKFKGEDTSTYSQYEDNPLDAIDKAREVLELRASGGYLMPMDEYIPANVAGVMLLFYEDRLDESNLQFCKDVVDDCISSSEHWMRILDGLEICVHAIPVLIKLFPEERLKYVNSLAKILCNHYRIGNNRACDYAIKCMATCDDDILRSQVIAHYLVFAVEKSQSATTLTSLTEDFNDKVKNLGLESAEVLLELLPKGTDNTLYRQLVNQLLPLFAETLKQEDNRSYSYSAGYDRHIYLYKAIADYTLSLKIESIETFLAPFIEYLNCDGNSKEFICQFVYAEDELRKTQAFRKVWQILYRPITENCVGYNNMVLQAFLLADDIFAPKAQEWHSLDDSDLWLYDSIVRDCGNCPATLYSIARNMNYITSRYVDKGIEWLYEITSNHPTINLRDREANTIFYMERFIGKVVRKNRNEIRKNKRTKNMLVTILTFLVERNSVQAFMLRDMIA